MTDSDAEDPTSWMQLDIKGRAENGSPLHERFRYRTTPTRRIQKKLGDVWEDCGFSDAPRIVRVLSQGFLPSASTAPRQAAE